MECVLFDLDQTLVESSALETLRDASQWPDVMAALSRTAPIPATCKLMRILKTAGIPVGVVTSAPKDYATALLALYELPCDVLVADEDASPGKPAPAPLRAALTALGGIHPQHAIYIGDSRLDLAAASGLGMPVCLWCDRQQHSDHISDGYSCRVATSFEQLVDALGLVENGFSILQSPVAAPAVRGDLPSEARKLLVRAPAYRWLQQELLPRLPSTCNAYIVGGLVRDSLLGKQCCTDCDIVVSGLFEEGHRDSYRTFACKTNLPLPPPSRRYDAIVFDGYGQAVDLWCLENSFQLRLFQLPSTIESFLTHVVFSPNAVALDLSDGALIWTSSCEPSLAGRSIEINTPKIYLPWLQIPRMLLLRNSTGMGVTSAVWARVAKLHRDEYRNTYLQHLAYKGRTDLVPVLDAFMDTVHRGNGQHAL